MAEELKQRRFEPVVRLELQAGPDPWVRELLVGKFELTEQDVYELPGELDYTGLFAVASLPRPELRDPPWTPVVPLMLPDPSRTSSRRSAPATSWCITPTRASTRASSGSSAPRPTTRRCWRIKMTVYRVGDDTPFVAVADPRGRGGQAGRLPGRGHGALRRGRNLHWAEELEKRRRPRRLRRRGPEDAHQDRAGGPPGGRRLRCYAHIGTGNYHVRTARLYTDLGLFTCDPVLTGDVVDLFHYLTGHSRKRDYQKLLVAPVDDAAAVPGADRPRDRAAREGRPARIIAKMNQLEDPQICEALCEASQAGVPIDLIVRGFCCLRPGVAGYTDNVRIISIIGRFLEHSRIYYFANGAEDPLDGEFCIGSADWMHRNLSDRVEAIAPIEPRLLKERLWEILQICLEDHRQAWDMQPDGTYIQRRPPPDATGPALEGTHTTLMARTLARSQAGRV